MILALKIILIAIMCISFLGAIAEQGKELRNSMTAVCISSMVSVVLTFLWL